MLFFLAVFLFFPNKCEKLRSRTLKIWLTSLIWLNFLLFYYKILKRKIQHISENHTDGFFWNGKLEYSLTTMTSRMTFITQKDLIRVPLFILYWHSLVWEIFFFVYSIYLIYLFGAVYYAFSLLQKCRNNYLITFPCKMCSSSALQK